MPLSIEAGWVKQARHCPSPNFNQRPPDTDIDLLVIHNISLPPGEFGTDCVREFFCNELDCTQHPYFASIAELRVSSHFLIERSGRITQFVSCDDRAWHAGKSFYAGRDNCNDFSIGIELEGTDDIPYTDAQYEALFALSACLMAHYPSVTSERITGHEHIAPGRKTDPGASFDWPRLQAGLKHTLARLNRDL